MWEGSSCSKLKLNLFDWVSSFLERVLSMESMKEFNLVESMLNRVVIVCSVSELWEIWVIIFVRNRIKII